MGRYPQRKTSIKTITRRTGLFAAAAALVLPSFAQEDTTAPHRPGTGRWTPAKPLPFAVQEIYPALHNGQIHLAGGFISEGNTISGATDRHISMNPESGSWVEVSRLPAPRHHPNLVSFDGHLLSVGGFEIQGPDAAWVMQPGVWVLTETHWQSAASLPQPNGESVCTVIDDGLHVCGGRKPKTHTNARWQDHSDVADHFVLNGIDGAWETAAPLPAARNSAAGAQIADGWHIVGGRTVAGGNSGRHDVYDAREDRWRSAAPLPQAQGGLAAASLNGVLYAFGGEYFDNGGGVYADDFAYDPSADAWTRITDMPNPRHGLGAVATGDAIYLIGGALDVGGSKTSAIVEIFVP